MARVHDLLDRHKALMALRNPWMPYWQQLADILLPTQAYFTSPKQPGEQIGQAIFDGSPRLALRDLSTTIDGLIKPKSNSWFDVELDNPDLSEFDEVKVWMEMVKDRMWQQIYRKDARFIQRSGEVDNSLTCFGWGVLWIQENKFKNGLLFRSIHNSRCAIDENDEGVIDTLSMSEMLTTRQAAMKWQQAGKDLPQYLKDAFANTKTMGSQQFEFVQIVSPDFDYDTKSKRGSKFPFKTCLIDVKAEQILDESGFYEFPASIPRWETSPGEIYPRSPGMMALPDSQTLQAMGKTLLVGGQRAVDPPMWVLNDSVMSPLRTFPGGITVLDANDNQTPIGAFPASTQIPVGREMQADYRAQVEAAFFKNVFNLPIETHQMTATEIIARKEEFIRVIGPVFGRLESDYIGHVVERVFGIMDRAGVFPPRPQILLETEAKVTFKFQSPIQKARKQMEIAGLSQSLQMLAPLAEVQPEIMDNFDGDEIARDAPEWGGLPMKWLRPLKSRDQLRQSRSEGAAAQQQLAESGPITEAIKNVAEADAIYSGR